MPTRPRILIADNDAANVQLLADICAVEELEVTVAQDGEETLKLIREDPPDLVLLDVMMPQRDGFEVLRALRDHPTTRTLPVILVTAVTDDDSIRKGYQLGANDYITKPFKVVELVGRMRNLLHAAAYLRLTQGLATWDVGDHQMLQQVLTDELARRLPVSLVLLQLVNVEAIERQHDRGTVTRALGRLAAQLRSEVRGVDSACLLPPDLLALVLVATPEEGARAVARRLNAQLERPIVFDELKLTLNGRWAVTTATDGGSRASDLIQRCVSRLASGATIPVH